MEDRLFEQDSRLRSLKSVQISDMPGGGVPVSMEEKLERKQELENRINRLSVANRKLRLDIYTVFDGLENANQAEVLEYYFIDCLTLESIAKKTKYSLRQVNRLYATGIRSCVIPGVTYESR